MRFPRTRANALVLFVLFLAVLVSLVSVSGAAGGAVLQSEPEARDLPGGVQVAQGLRQTEEAEEAEQRRLESPAAEAERDESRTAYLGLSAEEAEGLLQSQFAAQLALLDRDPARALTEARLEQVLGPSEAVIETEGRSVLMDGTFPVRAPDEEGDLRKVSLALLHEGGEFVPANPLSQVTLPEEASEGIAVGESGLSVAPETGTGEGSARRLDGEDLLFYPEVQEDTDLLAAPISSGLELFSQLRSPQSPEELRFAVQMPQGAQLQPDGEGGAQVSREGEALARIPAPVATDAQGAEVPVATSVEGSELVLQVSHRSLDLAYPILIDPAIVDEWYGAKSWYSGASLAALENGTWAQTSSDYGRYQFSTKPIFATFGGSNRGLFVSAKSTAETQWAYRYGQWNYTAPGQSTWIAAAGVYPFWRNDHGCSSTSYPEPHDYDGLWSPAWSPQYGWIQFQSNAALAYGQAFSEPPKDWRERTAQIYILGLGTGIYNTAAIPCWRDLYAGGAYVWLSDPEAPSWSSTPTASGAWTANTPLPVAVSASDKGLGVKSFKLFTTNGAGEPLAEVGSVVNPCSGGRASPCPASWSTEITNYNVANLPSGPDKLAVVAYDPLGETHGSSPAYVTVRVDHTGPKLTLSGPLTEGITKGPGTYALHVHAVDGTEFVPQTGVTKLEIGVDGTVVKTIEQSCPGGSCALDYDWSFDTTQYPGEDHQIEITATDQIGNVTGPTFESSPPDEGIPPCTATGKAGPGAKFTTTLLSGGGSATSYASSGGVTVEFPTPPAGFQPVYASAAELERYGFPPRPSDPETKAEWEGDMAAYQGTEGSEQETCNTASESLPVASSVVEEGQEERESGEEAGGTASQDYGSANWAGFATYEPQRTNDWVAVQGDFSQPSALSDSCSASQVVSWIGLGGYGTASLIQAGTGIDASNHYYAWWEYLGPFKSGINIHRVNSLAVHPGDHLHVYVSYSRANAVANFYLANDTTGKARPIIVRNLPQKYYDGSTTEFIDERPAINEKYSHLKNFGANHWWKAKAQAWGGNWQKLGDVNHIRIHMRFVKNGPQFAAPGFLQAGNTSFQDNWFHCHL